MADEKQDYNEIYYEIDRSTINKTDKKSIRLRSTKEDVESLLSKARKELE